MSIPRALTSSVGLWLLLVGPAVAVAAPETKLMTKEALAATEVKLLLPVLRTAVKEDYRRQAWYVATRIAIGEPKNPEAVAALRAWKGADLEEGREPVTAWLSVRDATFKKVGDAYALFARQSQTAGDKAVDSFPYLERAVAFGTADADTRTALSDAGYAWRGTYGSVKIGLVETALGALAGSVAFPPEFDDTVLRYRCVWPDAKAVEFGKTRLVSTLSPDDTWHTVALLTAEEEYFIRTFGSKAKESQKDRDEDDHTDLVVAPDVAVYGVLGETFVASDQRREFDGSSNWYSPWKRRLLMLAPVRDNAWTGRDSAITGQAVRPLIRRHMGAGASSWVHGRGAWLLDGFAGAFEAFTVKGPDSRDVEPARSWRLAATRELDARAAMVAWDDLFAMDAKRASEVAKRDLAFEFGGEKRAGKGIEVPAAQATALVLAIWQMDGGKGARKLGALVEELYKRDGLPNIDKALGLAPGKTVELTETFLRRP